MKTIREWLNLLPDGLREEALEAAKNYPCSGYNLDSRVPSMYSAIYCGFVWRHTSQGDDFWQDMRDKFVPIPKKEKDNRGFGTYCRRFKDWSKKELIS